MQRRNLTPFLDSRGKNYVRMEVVTRTRLCGMCMSLTKFPHLQANRMSSGQGKVANVKIASSKITFSKVEGVKMGNLKGVQIHAITRPNNFPNDD